MIDEVRDRLRPGMSATAVITTDRREKVITVPLQSLVERDQKSGKEAASGQTGSQTDSQTGNQAGNQKDRKPQKGVFTVENNKAVFAPVETGITGENDIEVKSGLTEGKEIITGPYRALRTLKTDQAIKREDKTKKPAESK